MKIFGYHYLVFLRRVKYYFYLKYCYIVFFKFKLISYNSTPFIDSKKFNDNIKYYSNRLFGKIMSNENTNIDEVVVNNIMSGKLEIFNYCLTQHQDSSKLDPITGFKWDSNCWYRNGYKDLPKGTDIKRPWEYSRMYFLLPLAIRYQKTKEDRIVLYIINYLKLWTRKNHILTAPNWSCTMDVSIRVANVAVAYMITSQSNRYTKNEQSKILCFINRHLYFIKNNLENISKLTSNHYISNIASLYVVLSIFPRNKKGQTLLNFSKEELEKEISKQTLSDGWNYELSSCYHRLVLEFFLFPFILSNKNEFTGKYVSCLKSMNRTFNTLIKPNGKLVQIGDNDSGRFMVVNDFNELGELKVNKFCNYVNEKLKTEFNENKFTKFENAKLYVYKSKYFYILFTCGVHGQYGIGGHSHDDTFSFELQINNIDIVVDPGTGTYTSDIPLRNKLRSISHHNTLFWENIQQSDFSYGPFKITNENHIKNTINSNNNNLLISGRNEYKGRWHERRIKVIFLKKIIIIEDLCSHPNAIVNFNVLNDIIEINSKHVKINTCDFIFKYSKQIEITNGIYSEKYGLARDINMLRVHLKNKKLTTTIRY